MSFLFLHAITMVGHVQTPPLSLFSLVNPLRDIPVKVGLHQIHFHSTEQQIFFKVCP